MMTGGKNFSVYGSIYLLEDPMIVENKGREMTLEKIFISLRIIDLSSNKFHGEIPHSIGCLNLLIELNLARNRFIGQIPLSLVNLTELESLDLSENHLRGEIPQGLATLTSLEFLNLSQNQLTGRIPQSGQFDTFQKDSFEGNPGLCGSPLPKQCGDGDNAQPESIPQQEKDLKYGVEESEWKVVLMGCGCGIVIGLVVGHIMLTPNRIDWCLQTCRLKRRQT